MVISGFQAGLGLFGWVAGLGVRGLRSGVGFGFAIVGQLLCWLGVCVI